MYPGVFAMQMDTEASLREYLKVQAQRAGVRPLGPLARAFDFVANAAPGVKEILTVGKVCWELRESLAGPRRLGSHRRRRRRDRSRDQPARRARARSRSSCRSGPVRNQTDWMVELLSDPALTALNVVTAPEEMPVNETIELVARAREELNVPLGVVIVNRVLPELFTHADEDGVRRAARAAAATRVLDASAPGRARPAVLDAARLAVSMRRSRSSHLGALREAGRPPAPAPAVPVRARPRPAGHPHGRRGARPGARVLMAARRAAASLEALLATREVVVFCGSGGVGKTSVAAAAARRGRDPASAARCSCSPSTRPRRLADALGLEAFGNVETPRAARRRTPSWVEPRGELYAAMLDTKRSWDELVLRHAPDEETAYRILDNRLYHNVTGRFVQSHDYIAMERLYDLHASGVYDLIIIDTPPTRNAIDFLEAPARMAEFFGGRLLRWLTMPYRIGGGRGARMINVASRPFYQVADRILGSQFLQDIAEFFLNFQSMYGGFVERAEVRRAAAARPAHDVRGRHHARGRAAARGGAVLRGAHRRATSTSARSCSTRRCPSTSSSTDGEHAADVLERDSDGARG